LIGVRFVRGHGVRDARQHPNMAAA
jgi:hypothetical protein